MPNCASWLRHILQFPLSLGSINAEIPTESTMTSVASWNNDTLLVNSLIYGTRYQDPTWEPEGHLDACKHLISRFLHKLDDIGSEGEPAGDVDAHLGDRRYATRRRGKRERSSSDSSTSTIRSSRDSRSDRKPRTTSSKLTHNEKKKARPKGSAAHPNDDPPSVPVNRRRRSSYNSSSNNRNKNRHKRDRDEAAPISSLDRLSLRVENSEGRRKRKREIPKRFRSRSPPPGWSSRVPPSFSSSPSPPPSPSRQAARLGRRNILRISRQPSTNLKKPQPNGNFTANQTNGTPPRRSSR